MIKYFWKFLVVQNNYCSAIYQYRLTHYSLAVQHNNNIIRIVHNIITLEYWTYDLYFINR